MKKLLLALVFASYCFAGTAKSPASPAKKHRHRMPGVLNVATFVPRKAAFHPVKSTKSVVKATGRVLW